MARISLLLLALVLTSCRATREAEDVYCWEAQAVREVYVHDTIKECRSECVVVTENGDTIATHDTIELTRILREIIHDTIHETKKESHAITTEKGSGKEKDKSFVCLFVIIVIISICYVKYRKIRQ